MYRIIPLLVFILSGCISLKSTAHYEYVIFSVPNGTGALNPIIESENAEGAFEMIQVNQQLKAISDTMTVWMEHFSPGAEINETGAMNADLLIMCYPDHLPAWAAVKHIFPWHEGEIHLYSVSENIIVVSNERIDLFDLVLHANLKEMQEIAGR